MNSRIESLAEIIAETAQEHIEKGSNAHYWKEVLHAADSILDVIDDYRADHAELYKSKEELAISSAAIAVVADCPIPPFSITYEKGVDLLNKLQAVAVKRAEYLGRVEK